MSVTSQIENQSAWFCWVSVTLRYLQEMETNLCVLQCCLQVINLGFYVLFYYIILGSFCFLPVYISFLIFVIFELNQTLPNMLKCVLRPAAPFFLNFFTNLIFSGNWPLRRSLLFQPFSSSTLETIIFL